MRCVNSTRYSISWSRNTQAAIERGLEKIRTRLEWSRTQIPELDAKRLKQLDDIVHLYTCLPTADIKVRTSFSCRTPAHKQSFCLRLSAALTQPPLAPPPSRS